LTRIFGDRRKVIPAIQTGRIAPGKIILPYRFAAHHYAFSLSRLIRVHSRDSMACVSSLRSFAVQRFYFCLVACAVAVEQLGNFSLAFGEGKSQRGIGRHYPWRFTAARAAINSSICPFLPFSAAKCSGGAAIFIRLVTTQFFGEQNSAACGVIIVEAM